MFRINPPQEVQMFPFRTFRLRRKVRRNLDLIGRGY